MQPKDGQGFLTFAHNTESVDYVNMAYMLALSVKRSCNINNFSVVVTQGTKLSDAQRDVFEHVIEIPETPPFYSECLAWELTPYKETFKLECDMLVPRSIDHWWDACRTSDVALTTCVRNYKGEISDSRFYRRYFDANDLVDAYNGCVYFRYSQHSKTFFDTARSVYQNWDIYRDRVLVGSNYPSVDTDVCFGVTAALLDIPCSLPLDYPTFTHMKGAINGWKSHMDWRDAVQWHIDNEHNLFVGGVAQQYPFHYYQKDFCTPELIAHYEF